MQKRCFPICAALLFLAVTFGLTACDNENGVGYKRYENAASYAVGNVDLDGSACTKVEIDWLGGSIEIEESADGLRVIEDGANSRLIHMDERMHYYLDGSVLKIKYCVAGYRGKIDETGKNLRVELPKGVSIEVDCTSANTVVGVIETPAFFFESDTGNLNAERIRCSRAELETVGGELNIGDIAADELSAESVRGNMQFGFSESVRAELENERGDIRLCLRGVGAQLVLENGASVVTDRAYTQNGRVYEFAQTLDGEAKLCMIEAETGSGKIYVK